jgi:hypothetical protein
MVHTTEATRQQQMHGVHVFMDAAIAQHTQRYFKRKTYIGIFCRETQWREVQMENRWNY